MTARHLDLLSNPALVTVVNPENLLQAINVVVVRAEDVDFPMCLTWTKLRSLKLSALDIASSNPDYESVEYGF